MQAQLKQEIYDVISWKIQVRFGTTIQSVASYLSKGSQSGSKIENSKQFKEQEEKRLEIYISENELWRDNLIWLLRRQLNLKLRFWMRLNSINIKAIMMKAHKWTSNQKRILEGMDKVYVKLIEFPAPPQIILTFQNGIKRNNRIQIISLN